MKIEGIYSFPAPRALVWSLLHNPEIIRRALPGCEKFDQVSTSEFTARLHIYEGPFAGEFKGAIQLTDKVVQEEFALGLTGAGPEGLIWGDGHIVLEEEEEGYTALYYSGELVVNGSTVTGSPRLLRTTANALIRQFLEELERYIQIQTGIYTTEVVNPSPNGRPGNFDMQDKIEKIRQDRRTTLFVLIFFAVISLMTVGAMSVTINIMRWGLRLVRTYVSHEIQEGQQIITLEVQE